MAVKSPVQSCNETDSPTFSQPPVVETGLGIQFAELDGFSSLHFGQFFELIKDRYDDYKDNPPVHRIAETFPKVSVPHTLHFSGAIAPLPRVFFFERGRKEKLIQLQQDRFGFNWSAADERDEPYPRYSENVARFLEEFSCFLDFCENCQIGPVLPDTCEVVYINQIFPQPDEKVIDLFANVFSGVEWRNADEFLPVPEVATLNRTYEIGDQEGRLYAEAAIARHPKKGDFVSLKMIARTFVDSSKSVESGLHLAHKWVVKGFVSLTDAEFRKNRWKQS